MISDEPQSAVPAARARARRDGGLAAAARRTVLGLALIAYTLLFAEGFVRIFDPQPVMPRYITGTPWGVRGNIPHAHYWHHTPEVDVQYRINGQGLRADQDFSLNKPAGTCRVGIFGDSFLFGLEVDLRDSFAYGLERGLRERGIPTQVLNFSVGGFGTAEMLQTYEGFGRKFDLDVAIFSWDISDLNDNVRSDLYRLRDGKLERANAVYLPAVEFQDMLMRQPVYRFLNDHSQLYTFVRDRVSVLMKARMTREGKQTLGGDADAEGAPPSGSEDIDEVQHRNALDLSAAILERARDVVTASGEEFYVLDIPARLSRTHFESTIGILPAASLARLEIISPIAALSAAARPDRKLYYERGLGHFTPAGTQILVDQAVDRLASSPRLAACAASEPTKPAAHPPVSSAVTGVPPAAH